MKKLRQFNLFRRAQYFANEAKVQAIALFMANQFVQKENWVQLSPFGDFANAHKGAKVIQRFRKEDADEICNAFNSPLRKIGQPFGMPFYIGHPDHPAFKGKPGHTDTAAKGRGKEMAVRHDAACTACADFANSKQPAPCADHGLFVKMNWNPDGEEIIANEQFHGHSINWGAVPAGKENGVAIFRPIRVKSAGFTNEPNIPVSPATLANELEEEDEELANEVVPHRLKLIAGFKTDDEVTMAQVIEALGKALNFANEIDEAIACDLGLFLLANAGEKPEDALVASLHEMLGTDPAGGADALKTAMQDKVTKASHLEKVKKTRGELDKASKKHESALNDLHTALANEKDARTTAETALANERRAHATHVVEGLVKSGKITIAAREGIIEELANAGDGFDARVTELSNAKATVKTEAKTRGLAGKHVVVTDDVRNRQQKLDGMLKAREVEFPNESYDVRFAAVSNSAEGVALFAQMQRPSTEVE